ncbi:MAG: hypothetical protein HWD58_17730 [Bacteroidota bacterium]|nr:MAG: hypothetical protein HWD58_17730 [Bacteroidota bacterium]
MQPNTFFSRYFGLISGALLLILGLFIILTRPHQNKTLAWFMVIYGTVRLGLAIYTAFLRKNTPNDPTA